MRKFHLAFNLAAMIPWLWLAVAAAGQAQPAPETAAKPPQPTPPLLIKNIPSPAPVTRLVVPPRRSSRQAPAWATYAFFFRHLGNLDQVADEQEALGHAETATAWRTHEKLAAGLDDREGDALRRVAADCVKALAAKDAELRAAAAALHAQHPHEGRKTPVPAEFHALWQERVQLIQARIDELRTLFGEERFLALDRYVRTSFLPGVKQPVIAEDGKPAGGAR